MPWVPHGISNGQITTRWPRRPDDYDATFPASIDITDVGPTDETRSAVDACPTGAISITESGVTLDRGRCILCGRCTDLAPDTFRARTGSDVAALRRQSLTVGAVTEDEETLRLIRDELAARVRRLRRSVHIRHVDAGSDGSDEWEVQALTNPVYDLHRLGIFFTASPRHADILLVTGIGTDGMREPLLRTRDGMPDPVVVIAVGTDAVSGGLVGGGYTGGVGIDQIVDVDVWVPGSPASPFALLRAILLALDRVPAAQKKGS